MIEKFTRMPDGATFMCKINELVDVVNKMQTIFDAYTTRFRQLDAESKAKIVNGFKNLQDPYAEQRKWIGKLCKFWNHNKERPVFGILTNIDHGLPIPFYNKSVCCRFYHCEPITADDELIYKGE